jgi:protein SCO1
LAFALAGCGRESPKAAPFHGSDISGSELRPAFTLEDASGARRRPEDFRGKLLLLYFGFTHCPDICPTTLADLAAARKALGEQRVRVQVAFVTLDPERDTGPALARYLATFDPDFVGLRGDAAATRDLAASFKLYVERRGGDGERPVSLDHTSLVFVFDGEGKPRLMFGPGVKPGHMAEDLRRLL